jgi:uncharacterized RDD family membrane protein YckC
MHEKTDEELIEIIEFQNLEYQAWAVEAARTELSKRDLSEYSFDTLKARLSYKFIEKAQLKAQEASQVLRGLNFLIDSATIFGIIYSSHWLMNGASVFSIPLMVFIFIAYYMVLEYYFGKTVGKFFTRTKVINKEGHELDWYQLYIRTMCRFIPVDFASYLFPFSGMKWHDDFSGTVVING